MREIPCYDYGMKRILTTIIAIVIIILAVNALSKSGSPTKVPSSTDESYKDISYLIEGASVKLEGGIAETEAAPGSESKVKTSYFGNEIKTDLDGDSREDVAFILTQDRGGSGTFYYAVAALNTENGYIGSDGYLLGDRIAPQSTNMSQNPRHKFVVVFNYADRLRDEPMTAPPTIGKSAYLKLNPGTMQWGVVEPDFEGEAR